FRTGISRTPSSTTWRGSRCRTDCVSSAAGTTTGSRRESGARRSSRWRRPRTRRRSRQPLPTMSEASRLEEADAWYRQLRRDLRPIVNRTVPTGSSIIVVSDGDDDLLRLGLREAQHFPQADDGEHAGFQPADDAE